MGKIWLQKVETMNNIAVLLAAYNGVSYLEEQIESILNQINVHITIFISIDPSSDGTREFLETKYKNSEVVKLLEDCGCFGGAAKNFFRLLRDVDVSSYDYVAFADQDDIWYTDKLSHAIQKLNETKSDGYSSNVLAFWRDGREKLIVKSQAQCEYDYLFEAAGPGCTYVMSNVLAKQIKQRVIEQWDEVNKLWLHDWFCYAYARANGFKWLIDDAPSMNYRQHASNQVGVNTGWKAFRHRLHKILYGGAIEQSVSIARLVGMENHNFVKKWSNLSRYALLKLAFYAPVCRRKKQEKVFFFIACILMAIMGKGK